MKRYRILALHDFDTRVTILEQEIDPSWDKKVQEQHRQNRENTIRRLVSEFGEVASEQKIQNFIDLGTKPFSVIAFHNRFFAQARNAFVIGSYYPALTGACALGERILNHLILRLRDDYKTTEQYKRVCRKDSFDDWTTAIDTLHAWDVLLPNAVSNFRKLMRMRHRSLHFRPETDHNDRGLALDAIRCLQEIIGEQFSGFGPQPWFITSIPGEIYIKKKWENRPFVREIYLPNGFCVGPHHKVESLVPQLKVLDSDEYDLSHDISDEEYSRLRKAFRDGGNGGNGG